MKNNMFFILLLVTLSVPAFAYPDEYEVQTETISENKLLPNPAISHTQPVSLENLFLLPINYFKTISEQYIHDKFKDKALILYNKLIKQLNKSALLISTGIKNLEYYGLLKQGSAEQLETKWNGIIEPILEAYLKGRYSLYLTQENEHVHLKVQNAIPQDLLDKNMEARESLRQLQERMEKAMNEQNEKSLAEFVQGLSKQSLSSFHKTFKKVEEIGAKTTADMLIVKLSDHENNQTIPNQDKEAIIKEYQDGVQNIILKAIQDTSLHILKKMYRQYSLITNALKKALPESLSNIQIDIIPEVVDGPSITTPPIQDRNNNASSEDIIKDAEKL